MPAIVNNSRYKNVVFNCIPSLPTTYCGSILEVLSSVCETPTVTMLKAVNCPSDTIYQTHLMSSITPSMVLFNTAGHKPEGLNSLQMMREEQREE